MSIWAKVDCWRYRTRLEERVSSSNGLRPEADAELDAHLEECADCARALDEAVLATELLRDANSPARDSNGYFTARVMASIREEMARRSAPELIWRPLALFASRFAMVAAGILLVCSIYMAEFAPPLRVATVGTTAENAAAEVVTAPETVSQVDGPVMPEPPAVPSSPDEVLASLAGEAAQ